MVITQGIRRVNAHVITCTQLTPKKWRFMGRINFHAPQIATGQRHRQEEPTLHQKLEQQRVVQVNLGFSGHAHTWSGRRRKK